MTASAIAVLVASIFAIHTVSWSYQESPSNSVFVPISLIPFVSATIWAPLADWAQFAHAGILFVVALAPLQQLDNKYKKSDAARLWQIAMAESILVVVTFASMATGDGAGGALTHLVCTAVSFFLLVIAALF